MTIEQLKARLSRKFSGSSLDDIEGISDFSLFGEAASNVLSELDPYETVRIFRFNQFGSVYDYAAPSDLKGKKLIDPRPQDGRRNRDFSQTYTKTFDRDKEFDFGKVSVEMQDGNKVIRLSESGKGSAQTDDVSATTGWSAAGGATNLEEDSIQRLDGSDTLRFDLGATGGYIENVSLDQMDLSTYEDTGSFFRKILIPSGAEDITSITLRIGSASGAYWSITGEAQFGSLKNGVNLVRFDWANATETGSPDAAAVDYERLVFVTTAAIADVRIGPLFARLPQPFEVPYYSNCLFKSAAGDWLTQPENDTDTIVLEFEAQNIFFYECCVLVAEDLSLDEDAVKFRKKLGKDEQGNLTGSGLYGNYKEDKPTEKLRPTSRYMNLRPRRNGRGLRRR